MIILPVAKRWGGGPFSEAEWWRGPSVSPRINSGACHLPIAPDQVRCDGEE